MKRSKQNGITLIALVITIIVLLILAAISIATLTGDDGILNQANKAKNDTGREAAKEKVEVKVLGSYGTDGNLDYGLLEDNLNKIEGIQGVPSPITDDSFPLTVTVDGYDVTIKYNGDVTVEDKNDNPPSTTGKTDGSYDTAKGVNTPKLEDNMKLVVYDNGNWVEDTTKSAYKYEAQAGATDTYNGETGEYGTSHWANAVLEENYYVWIPRYAYKIDKSTPYTSQSGTSYKIDVKFLIGTTNKYYDESGNEKEAKIATNADEISAQGNTDYYVHPAFTFGTQNLEGLWIGKYESSDAGNEKISIVPNATSLRNINVSTMFERAQSLSKTNIDAHMLKNTEWGAVAYLTQSQYGRNGTEVSVNQCSSYITGTGRGTGDNQIYNSTYSSSAITDDQRYNGEIGKLSSTTGKLSSTTGNVYGIYDMSGGAYEYVMGVYGTNNSPTVGRSGFTDEDFPEEKYYNLYVATSANNSNIGDALYEISGWNSDSANFVSSGTPFFVRGGYYYSASNAGVFYYVWDDGSGSSSGGFRVCLAVQ